MDEIPVKWNTTVRQFIELLESIPDEYKDKEIGMIADYWTFISNISYVEEADTVFIS